MDTPRLTKNIRWWYLWAVLCFIPPLFFYYVGEEGVYTLNAMEMWQRQEFRSTVMYGMLGGGGGRPPLFSWLVIPVASGIGWENVLVAARVVTVAATVGTSLITAWLAQQLWRENTISWMAALLYLVTADVLLYRGWLSYADPLFAMMVVLAIAMAWVACLRSSYPLLAGAVLAIFAAFLTKAFTAYVFLGVGLLVFLMNAKFRRFLLSLQAWAIYAFALLLPLMWLKFGTHDAAQHITMLNDITVKLTMPNIGDYLIRLVLYPLEMFIRLMPASLFIGYLLIRKRGTILEQHPAIRQSLLLAVLNFLPYWLAPYGGARYLLPIYPFLVLPAAYLVTQQAAVFAVKRWTIGMLIFATVVNFFVFPFYQQRVRGENYRQMAIEIIAKYGQYPLYASNVSSVGLSVVANIDSLRFNQPALIWPPSDFKEGIVIAHAPDDVPGTLLRKFQIKNDAVFLICRGTACAPGK